VIDPADGRALRLPSWVRELLEGIGA
jgi:hypothetical protein